MTGYTCMQSLQAFMDITQMFQRNDWCVLGFRQHSVPFPFSLPNFLSKTFHMFSEI